MASNAAGWFPRLRNRLPQLMAEPPRQAWATASFLAASINQHRDTVVALLQLHWMANAIYFEHALHVLCDLRSWNTESLGVAFGCVNQMDDQTPGDTFRIWRLMEAIYQSHPNLSLKLFCLLLERQDQTVSGRLAR